MHASAGLREGAQYAIVRDAVNPEAAENVAFSAAVS
jgi:hypothetical protein